MKAVAGKIGRERRSVLRAISPSKSKEAILLQEYQTIFKNNGKPMVIVDDDTTISLANAEFERLSGYSKKEIEGTKKWTEFVARQDRRRMKEYHLLRKSDPMLAPRCCEFRFVDRYGKIKNVVLTIGQIPGTTRSMASLQDVTERRQAEVTQQASEERYQTFFENSRDAVYITTSDGSYVDANRAALDLFGYTREEMKKLKARQLYADPDDAWRLRKEIEEKGFAQDFEVRLRKKDGTEMDCQFTVTALRGDDGSILEYQGIARDMTERKRAEKELRKSEEKYRDIFDSMLEGYFEVDLAGNVTFFNEAVTKFHGYSSDELIGLNYRKFTSPEEAQRLFQVFSEVYKTDNTHEIDDYEIIKKDGSIGIAEFSISLLRNAAGEPIGFRGVTRDVTEKRKMEETLRQGEESYKKILELAPEGITVTRMKDDRYLLVNNGFCRHTGYSVEEAVGHTALELNLFANPADRERLVKAVQQNGSADGIEIQFRAKNGNVLNCIVSVRPVLFQGQNCRLVVVTDINAIKTAQLALQESEERYRALYDRSLDCVFIMDFDGKFVDANQAALDLLGYDRSEIGSVDMIALLDERDLPQALQDINDVMQTGFQKELKEYRLRRKGGGIVYVEIQSSVLHRDGKPYAIQGIARDITARKQAEEALTRSEEKYRTILETMQEAYYETDLAGNLNFVNDALCRHLGYTKEELIGKDFQELQNETTAKKMYELYNKVYRTGEPVKAIETEYARKDGTKGAYEISVSLIRDAEGEPIGFRGVSRDVTQRKQAEEALRRSEGKYRTILENIQDGYFEVDLAGNFTFVNDALCRNLRYSKDELIGMNNRQYTDKENAKKVFHAFNNLYRTGVPGKVLDYETIRKDGTKAFTEISISLIRDAEDKPIGFRGIDRDITERRQAEEALARSEERYRTILETMQEAYYETDLAGKLTFANDGLCKHLGYSKEEAIGMDFRQYQDKVNAKKTYEVFKGIYETGDPIRAREAEYIRKDGTKGTYELSVSLFKDAQGKPIGFRGISRDVSERKEMEEALRQSEERYRTILESIEDGYAEFDPKGNITFFNDALPKMLGYPADELKNLTYKNREYMEKEDAEKVYQTFTEVYATGKPIRGFQYRIITQDGTKRYLEGYIALKKDAGGQPVGFQGLARDITERKQAEEKLRQSEERYRGILANMQEAYYETDLAGHFTFVNDATCRHLGYSKEELIGADYRRYQNETNYQKIAQAFNAIYGTGEPLKALEAEYIRKDGSKGPYELSASLIRDAQGKPVGFCGVSRDVTERRKAEEQLKRYAAELERSNEEVKNFAYIVSHDLRVPLVNLKGYTSELRTALGVIGANFEAALPHLNDDKRSEVAMALHEDVPEALEFITNSVSRMDSFINAVLILSRLGRQDLRPEPIDMNAMVHAALKSMSHQIKEQGIEVQVESLPQVVADRTAMERIMGNILSNAVKYVDPERPCRIEVGAEANNGEMLFSIRDTGRGIAQEDMHKVFAPFRRAGKQDTQGEGMGLAYVQTLVRRHGGRIWCESALGKGTTFTFTIPATFKQGASDA
jgi:PAS domain S-box-containing protein